MEENKHCITIDYKEKFTATGIKDILSFDEENIIAKTIEDILIIKGENLHISTLNLDKGLLVADGSVKSLSYESEILSKDSFLGRLFK